MKFSKMIILTSAFSMTSLILFLSLFGSDGHIPILILNISLAMVFFALAVMNFLIKARKRQLEQLKRPFHLSTIAFGFVGVSGASRSMVLGLQTGAWEYWVMMMNLLFFVAGVIVLWYNTFIEKLLEDIKEK